MKQSIYNRDFGLCLCLRRENRELCICKLHRNIYTLEQVVDALSLKALKARLDVALGILVWWLAILHKAGGVETR